MAFRHVIADSDGKLRRNLGKSIVAPSTEIVVPSPSIFRKGLGQSSPVESIQYVEAPKTSAIRKGLGKNMQSVTGSVAPQTINIPYVANGEYKGVFYQIGTKLETESYLNPCFFDNAFRVSLIFESLLSNNQSLSPHRLFVRPSVFSLNRNPFHTSNGGTTYITISLPSGFRLKPTGFAMQSRTDFTSFHTSELFILGCNNVSDSSNAYTSLGSYSTGFTSGSSGQFYVDTSISTSQYFNAFRITRTANTDSGTYFTGNFFEMFGELKIYE